MLSDSSSCLTAGCNSNSVTAMVTLEAVVAVVSLLGTVVAVVSLSQLTRELDL